MPDVPRPGHLQAIERLLRQFPVVALLGHPKVGASWEGFLLGEVVRHMGADWDQCHFWATHAEAELDLLVTDRAVSEASSSSGPPRPRSHRRCARRSPT